MDGAGGGAPERRGIIRVGIDATAFGATAPGVRRYAVELSRAMGRLDHGIDLVPIGGDPRAIGAARPPGSRPAAVTMVSERRGLPTNLGRSLSGLPLAIARAGVHLFHAPAYTAPLWGPTPVVLTIHDVSYARHPEWYPYRRDPLRRWFYRRSARQAARVITVSEFSKSEIVAAYGLPPGSIAVIAEGVAPVFAPARSAADHDDDKAVVARVWGRPLDRYLLHVGDMHERRNLGLALRTLARLRTRLPTSDGVGLVLVGADRGVLPGLLAEAGRLGLAGAVLVAHDLPDDTLAALYRQASALVYPSRYEGFGLPLVEAMACGTPVVAARAAATPEVLGQAGSLVAPDDETGFAAAVERILTDRGWAADRAAAGLARARAFDWDETARRTGEVYRSCLAPAGA